MRMLSPNTIKVLRHHPCGSHNDYLQIKQDSSVKYFVVGF